MVLIISSLLVAGLVFLFFILWRKADKGVDVLGISLITFGSFWIYFMVAGVGGYYLVEYAKSAGEQTESKLLKTYEFEAGAYDYERNYKIDGYDTFLFYDGDVITEQVTQVLDPDQILLPYRATSVEIYEQVTDKGWVIFPWGSETKSLYAVMK